MVDHYGWTCCLGEVATVMCIVDIEGGALSVAFVEEANGDFFLMTLFSGREHRTHLKKRLLAKLLLRVSCTRMLR
jgi:hypothetical protein